MKVTNKIKHYRLLRELTQGELALLAGKSRAMIAKYEAQDHQPMIKDWKQIASLLKTTEKELFTITW